MNKLREINGKYYRICEAFLIKQKDMTTLMSLYLHQDNKLQAAGNGNAYIIITSDEEIKVNDHFYHIGTGKIEVASRKLALLFLEHPQLLETNKKIIATNNTGLQYDSRQRTARGKAEKLPFESGVYYANFKPTGICSISKEFKEKYVKQYNNGFPIKKLLVEYVIHSELHSNLVIYDLMNDRRNCIGIRPIHNDISYEQLVDLFSKFQFDLENNIEGSEDAVKWLNQNL